MTGPSSWFRKSLRPAYEKLHRTVSFTVPANIKETTEDELDR
ncbi:hypothetical protein ACVMH6_000563 [Rhizobium leguminosarum]|jgi:hypothetical protein